MQNSMKNNTCASGRGEQKLPNNDQLILLKDAVDEFFMWNDIKSIKDDISRAIHYELTHPENKDEKLAEASEIVFAMERLINLIDMLYGFYSGYDAREKKDLEDRLKKAKERLTA